MNKQHLVYAAGAVAVLAVGAIAYSSLNSGAAGLMAAGGGAPSEIKETDRVHGSPDAPVTMIEYASMTCSHCALFQTDVLPDIQRDYIDTGKVKLVFREFPLDGAARMASAAARCLTDDAYFSFIDMLFRNQQQWLQDFDQNQQLTQEDVQEGLVQEGRVAGLGREQILSCVNDPVNLAEVDANWQEGQTLYSVNSTPTFVINGNVHRGAMTYDAFQGIIDPLLGEN